MHPRDARDIEACRQALRGEMDISRAAQLLLEGRALASRWAQGISETQSLYLLAAEIEAANLPTDELRALWEPHELAEKDEHKQQIEAKHRDAALAAFRAIINDYRESGLPISAQGEEWNKRKVFVRKYFLAFAVLWIILLILLKSFVFPNERGWLSAPILISIFATFVGGLLNSIFNDLRRSRRHLRKGGKLSSVIPTFIFLFIFLCVLYSIIEPYFPW